MRITKSKSPMGEVRREEKINCFIYYKKAILFADYKDQQAQISAKTGFCIELEIIFSLFKIKNPFYNIINLVKLIDSRHICTF